MQRAKAENVEMVELHIGRAYLPSHWVKQRSEYLTIFCKVWPVRNGDHFTKADFVLDWEQGLNRRIPDIQTLESEITAWNTQRNADAKTVSWRFTTENARIKLKRLYPVFND
jgi:hypothetical protein